MNRGHYSTHDQHHGFVDGGAEQVSVGSQPQDGRVRVAVTLTELLQSTITDVVNLLQLVLHV